MNENYYNILDRIKLNVCNSIGMSDPAIVNMIDTRLRAFIEYSRLPARYYNEFIDTNVLPAETKKLYDEITTKITLQQNIGIKVSDFRQSRYLISCLIEKYSTPQFIQDNHLYSILYIDTNLLLSDYKKLIGRNTSKQDSVLQTPFYDLDILYKEVYRADYIFWDKFNLFESSYETDILYEILSVRYMNCLGNTFVSRDGNIMGENHNNELFKRLRDEISNVMNLSETRNLQLDKYVIVKENVSND